MRGILYCTLCRRLKAWASNQNKLERWPKRLKKKARRMKKTDSYQIWYKKIIIIAKTKLSCNLSPVPFQKYFLGGFGRRRRHQQSPKVPRGKLRFSKAISPPFFGGGGRRGPLWRRPCHASHRDIVVVLFVSVLCPGPHIYMGGSPPPFGKKNRNAPLDVGGGKGGGNPLKCAPRPYVF